MELFVLYLAGCIIAFLILDKQYTDNLPQSIECNDACAVYAFGTMLSWITVIIYLYNKCFNKE